MKASFSVVKNSVPGCLIQNKPGTQKMKKMFRRTLARTYKLPQINKKV